MRNKTKQISAQIFRKNVTNKTFICYHNTKFSDELTKIKECLLPPRLFSYLSSSFVFWLLHLLPIT